jgi:hypothetical protein
VLRSQQGWLATAFSAGGPPALGQRCESVVGGIRDERDRPRPRGAELVGELERYEDSYWLCYVRGPKGIIVELAEQIGCGAPSRDWRLLHEESAQTGWWNGSRPRTRRRAYGGPCRSELQWRSGSRSCASTRPRSTLRLTEP